MTHFEVQDALESLTVLIDTREHVDTPGFQRRAAHFPRWRREKGVDSPAAYGKAGRGGLFGRDEGFGTKFPNTGSD